MENWKKYWKGKCQTGMEDRMKRRFIAAMMAAVLTGSLMACGSGAASGKT